GGLFGLTARLRYRRRLKMPESPQTGVAAVSSRRFVRLNHVPLFLFQLLSVPVARCWLIGDHTITDILKASSTLKDLQPLCGTELARARRIVRPCSPLLVRQFAQLNRPLGV